MKNLKIFAAGCSFLYIICFLFLPVICERFTSFGLSGIDCLSYSPIAGILPIIAGAVMILLIFLNDKGFVPGIVCGICAFMPLISFAIMKSSVPSGSAVISIITSIAATVGVGVILPMLLGIAAAVLCFLSDRNTPPKPQREAGLGSTIDEDW